jgi:hypothetical protein
MSTSGLLMRMITSPACTWVPGSDMICSMRPGVTAVMKRRCSGTSVPGPRTCRMSVPNSTVSRHTTLPSTVGAAVGRSLGTKIVSPSSAMAARLQTIFFRFFWGLVSLMMSKVSSSPRQLPRSGRPTAASSWMRL